MLEPALVVFDDQRGSFGPLTDLRAAFELRAGLSTCLERIEHRLKRRASALFCAPAVAPLLRERHSALINALPPGDAFELVSGACMGTLKPFRCNREHAEMLVGACSEDAAGNGERTPWAMTARIAQTLTEDLDIFGDAPVLANCERRALRAEEGQSIGAHPIMIDRSASIGPLCVIDASKGPVVLGAGVIIGPCSVLIGPCAILDSSVISPRALIKANTVIGPHCRIGGEVGGTIFQGFSNKSHDGHLGDAFVGEWVNIGAGTDNSNLLNTYGEVIVRLEADGGLVRTGTQFWGCVIGDHAKFAIGTRIMTGTTIGTGAMVASSRPPATLVDRFAWITDSAEAARTFRMDKFLDTARAMMQRRGQTLSPAAEARLRELHTKAQQQ